ncbi:sarcosine oxidase subunit gamma [Komagataeibacter sp. FNDCF1]|uniref:sarcosine oxidase subunit gamma n=1 Tax=Komagataeibacter sp. FNDCF1 TaxID=2878681 RepID=UPI001E54981F|nr:sarcosine oxidase subunit gamma [Komagataeibacter sp. FNDCF1]MCE2563235.1 sarcosine oxidase subunit gamma [Komagataeibacter sp. FNDCF1]
MPETLQPRHPVPFRPLVIHGLTLGAGVARDSIGLAPLRGREDALRTFMQAEFGVALPHVPRCVENAEGLLFQWAGPSQWLVRGPPCAGLSARLSPCTGLAAITSQTDSRIALELSGRGADAVAAKLVAVDLHPRVFTPGHVAVTLAGHIPVTLRQVDATPRYEFLVFRSQARSLHHELSVAMSGGIPQVDPSLHD